MNFLLDAPGQSSTFSWMTMHTWKIWGSHSCVAENSSLLGCYSMCAGKQLQIFRRTSCLHLRRQAVKEEHTAYRTPQRRIRIRWFQTASVVTILYSNGLATRIHHGSKNNVTTDSSPSVRPTHFSVSSNTTMMMIYGSTIIWDVTENYRPIWFHILALRVTWRRIILLTVTIKVFILV